MPEHDHLSAKNDFFFYVGQYRALEKEEFDSEEDFDKYSYQLLEEITDQIKKLEAGRTQYGPWSAEDSSTVSEISADLAISYLMLYYSSRIRHAIRQAADINIRNSEQSYYCMAHKSMLAYQLLEKVQKEGVLTGLAYAQAEENSKDFRGIDFVNKPWLQVAGIQYDDFAKALQKFQDAYDKLYPEEAKKRKAEEKAKAEARAKKIAARAKA